MVEIPTTIKNKGLVQKKREQIVFAAIKLFAQKGFFKTTLRDLSEEAGISHGNIYDYVGVKEDIFFLVHEYIDKVVTDTLLRSLENIKDPFEKLKRMIRSEFNLMYQLADAILLIYQESHILSKPPLKKMLKKERAHTQLYEDILEECIRKGLIQDFNTRAIANIIKVMVDGWVLKRWDLRNHVTQLEMEKSIIDLVFNGLINVKGFKSSHSEHMKSLKGKTVLFINGSTPLGETISSFLISKGARLCIYNNTGTKGEIDFSASIRERSKKVRIYSSKEDGHMSQLLFSQIIDDLGYIDIIIQDLGIGNMKTTISDKNMISFGKRLEANLTCAQDMSSYIETEMTKRESGKIIYLAPWAWDQHANPLRYRTVKAGTAALTQSLATRLGASRINVNCVVPGYITGIGYSKNGKENIIEVIDRIPMNYIGEMQDILETVYFLISDSSKYLTGQVLEVAGGKNLVT